MSNTSTSSASYSTNVANSILDYFKSMNFDFDFDAEKGIITTAFPTDSKIGQVDIRIRFLSDGYISHAISRISADENSRDKVAEYLTRANYGLRNGNFEMDFRDGEIRFKAFCRSGDTVLEEMQIHDSFILPIVQFDTYGDDLLAVLFGMKEPEQAIQDAESK
ncbi:MAG: hypothetical protein ACOX7K_09195 [Oscillospiraceae bacterium]|jgi:hypothetical protein